MRPGRLRAVRWTEMSIVFPGRAARAEPGAAGRRPDRRGDRAPPRRREPEGADRRAPRDRRACRRTERRLSAPALGRSAPARAHRARPRVQPARPHRGRADDRARRDGAGAGARAPREAAARTRALDDPHHARPLDALVRLPANGCDVRGARSSRTAVRPKCSTSPKHPYTTALAAAFPRIGDHAHRMSPSGSGGRSARPARAPSRVPVPSAVRVAVRRSVPTSSVELWPAGDARRAACIHVRDVTGL